jgi:hypothetical protein
MGGGESGDGRSSEGEGGVDAAAETNSIVSSVAAAADFHTNTMKKIEAAKAQVRSQSILHACPSHARSPSHACPSDTSGPLHAPCMRGPAACMHASQGHPQPIFACMHAKATPKPPACR